VQQCTKLVNSMRKIVKQSRQPAKVHHRTATTAPTDCAKPVVPDPAGITQPVPKVESRPYTYLGERAPAPAPKTELSKSELCQTRGPGMTTDEPRFTLLPLPERHITNFCIRSLNVSLDRQTIHVCAYNRTMLTF